MTVESLANSTVKLLADQVKHLTSCHLQIIIGDVLMNLG